MVRPTQLTAPRLKRRKFNQALAIQQTGARYIGRANGKRSLYELGGGVFTAPDLLQARERYAHYKFNIPKKKAKKLVGLN